MSGTKVKVWLPLMLAVSMSAGLFIGYRIQENQFRKVSVFQSGKVSKIDEILHFIGARYVDKVDTEDLYEAGIDKILSNLDPHSSYIPREDLISVNEEMSGNFEGIGIEFFIVRDTIMVVTPIPGGPSIDLGIRSGDKIVEIEDSVVAGIGIRNRQVVKKLKGPRGTKVKILVKRSGQPELIAFEITRDKVPFTSLDASFMVDENTGYIRLSRFSATTHREFMDALYPMTRDHNLTNLILDLRDNQGGYLTQATDILDEFIDGRKELVYTQGLHTPKQVYNANKPGIFEQGQLIILINENSASASEIVAGAVQDWDRGLIIGRRSYGKGLVQEQYMLTDGSALRLTVSKYYTPSGRCIQVPYEDDEDFERYRNSLSERYEHGELFYEDSMDIDESLVYTTKIKGREVYGGGGIVPDVFIPVDTSFQSPFFMQVSRMGLIQEYAYTLLDQPGPEWKEIDDVKEFIENFVVSDETLAGFLAYAEGRDIHSAKIAESSVNEIKARLKAHIAKVKWGNDAFYQVAMRDDPFLRAALGNFADPVIALNWAVDPD